MRDVVCLYHPEFKKSADLRSYGLKHSDIFNIERLVEESLAALGPYEFVDEKGYDFTDFSDSKTTTVNEKTGAVTITGVETKIGALRITAYNPFKEATDFFFVPKQDLDSVKKDCYGINEHKKRIMFNYSRQVADNYCGFEKYRVQSFEALALA
jgi:hypothetical protein